VKDSYRLSFMWPTNHERLIGACYSGVSNAVKHIAGHFREKVGQTEGDGEPGA
jgi:hypothetical protein